MKRETKFESALRKNFIKILILGVISALLFFLIGNFLLRPEYRAHSILRIVKQQEEGKGMAEDQRALNTYNEIIHSSTIREKVLSNLEIKFTPARFNKKVYIDRLGDSNLLSVFVQDTIPERAKDLANETAEILQEDIGKFVEGEEAIIIETAQIPDTVYFPKKINNIILGFLVGVAIGMIMTAVKSSHEDSFDSVEELRERFDYPILVQIPQINKLTTKSQEINDLFVEGGSDEETQE